MSTFAEQKWTKHVACTILDVYVCIANVNKTRRVHYLRCLRFGRKSEYDNGNIVYKLTNILCSYHWTKFNRIEQSVFVWWCIYEGQSRTRIEKWQKPLAKLIPLAHIYYFPFWILIGSFYSNTCFFSVLSIVACKFVPFLVAIMLSVFLFQFLITPLVFSRFSKKKMYLVIMSIIM